MNLDPGTWALLTEDLGLLAKVAWLVARKLLFNEISLQILLYFFSILLFSFSVFLSFKGFGFSSHAEDTLFELFLEKDLSPSSVYFPEAGMVLDSFC